MRYSFYLEILKSFLPPGGLPKVANAILHRLKWPEHRYSLICGLNIIHRCNLSCSFCAYGGFHKQSPSYPDIDLDTFTTIINHEIFKYSFYATFGLGEPLLHDNLFQYIAMLNKRKIISCTSTNATLLEDRHKEFSFPFPNIVRVSYYKSIQDKQSNGIRLLMGSKTNATFVALTKLISKDNIEEMAETMLFSASLGIKRIWFQQFIQTRNTKVNTYPLIYDNDTEAARHIADMKKYQKSKYPDLLCAYPHPIPTSPAKCFCNVLSRGPYINSDGSVQPCCAIEADVLGGFGNIFKNQNPLVDDDGYMRLKRSFGGSKEKLFTTCKDCFFLNYM